jgi:DNA invertase Pin-like site-specific DNA recombinase
VKIGYAWVSVDDQDLEAQVNRLKTDGCGRVFSDQGENGRPQWDMCLEHLSKGDTLVVVHLDRLTGAGIGSVLETVNDLGTRGIKVRVTDRFRLQYRPGRSSSTRQ